MTGLTWRPVREDDLLDPGDRVRITRSINSTIGHGKHPITWKAYHEFCVMSDGPAGVWLRGHPLDWRCDWLLAQRADLEVPR